jgi:CMP-N-acetylneuraminic acid synthetase
MRPKATVYIPSHDYGRFLPQAIESVRAQSMPDWEMILIDDGSSDDTATIVAAAVEADPQRVRAVHHDQARGLAKCANVALEMARGEYVMRLDADDWLDENALLVLCNHLDRHPDIALVYPNYVYVDEAGAYLGREFRKRVGLDAKLLDLPAHGACTLVRRRVLKMVGGYDETARAQDGYELWLKVLNRFAVANVATPLFFYRQHGTSLSRNEHRLLSERQRIKRRLVGNGGAVKPRMIAVVPAKNTYANLPNVALSQVAGRALIDHTLDHATDSGLFDLVVVTTDSPEVMDHVRGRDRVWAMLRPPGLSFSAAGLAQVLWDAVMRLESEQDIFADVVVLLSIHSPLRRPEHIVKAVDTLLLFNPDSVCSVYEDTDIHFSHGANGLEPLNRGAVHQLRLEREALYVDNGAIKALWRDALTEDDLFGGLVSHIVMPRECSFQIKSPFDLWLVGRILEGEATEGCE